MVSTEINLEQANGDNSLGATCYLMPCRIEHKDLHVKSREYFWPTVKELRLGGDDDEGRKLKHDQLIDGTNNPKERPILTASFRGKPFQGKRIELPEGYSGHVIGKSSASDKLSKNSSATATTRVKKHFNQFTYWNWDELPSKEDTVVRGLGWLDVAKAIHDPIE